MCWHDYNPVNLLTRYLPLRWRLALGYLLAIFVFTMLGILTFHSAGNIRSEIGRFSDYAHETQQDFQLVKNITELEQSTFMFINDGDDSAAMNVYRLYEEIQQLIDDTDHANRQDFGIESYKKRIETILSDYIRTFKKAQNSRNAQTRLIEEDFRTIAAQLFDTLDRAVVTAHTQTVALMRMKIALLSAEKNAFRYLDTLDNRYYKAIRADLSIAEKLVEVLASTLPASFRLNLQRYRAVFLRSVQHTRGYLYMVNVVLAAQAYEMQYQARQVAQTMHRQMQHTRDGFLANIDRHLLMFTVLEIVFFILIVVLSWLIGRSIIRPIKQLTDIFLKLANGSRNTIELVYPANDEISELAYAAEAFRRTNVEHRRLVDRYRNLNETLEQKVYDRTLELEEKNRALDTLANSDILTGLYNRSGIQKVLDAVFEAHRNEGVTFALIMIDIDRFKRINDTFGHQIGDEVLKKLAHIMQTTRRKTDSAGRWGGEEFLLICPQTDGTGAMKLAEQLRRSIEASSTQAGRVTASFGIAVCRGDDTVEALLRRADNALYCAKHNGRNRVEYEDTA